MIAKSRSGFTLIFAIFMLTAISGMMALMLSFSSQTVSQTTDIYLKEQAILLSKSATEFALLAISGHDRNETNPAASNCLNYIDATYDNRFDIHTTIKYIGLGTLANCQTLHNAGAINTPESNGTVMIDVYVTYNDNNISNPIRYHRRTLQKP